MRFEERWSALESWSETASVEFFGKIGIQHLIPLARCRHRLTALSRPKRQPLRDPSVLQHRRLSYRPKKSNWFADDQPKLEQRSLLNVVGGRILPQNLGADRMGDLRDRQADQDQQQNPNKG